MSATGSSEAALRQARVKLGEVRKHLLKPTPKAVAECPAILEQCIGWVNQFERSLKDLGIPRAERERLRSAAAQFEKERLQTEALLGSALALYAGWSALAAEPEDLSYSPDGSERHPQPRRSLSLQA